MVACCLLPVVPPLDAGELALVFTRQDSAPGRQWKPLRSNKLRDCSKPTHLSSDNVKGDRKEPEVLGEKDIAKCLQVSDGVEDYKGCHSRPVLNGMAL